MALQTPCTQDFGMTGEITLMGKILPVGGIKEKVMAAHRVGLKKLVLPKDNQKDYEKLPPYLKDKLEVHYAEEYKDVFNLMFPSFALP